jgi:hypothetical protein
MSKTSKPLPEWERVLSAASRLQTIVPDAILVGGTAVAIHTGHRQSQDADHVVENLRQHFEQVLADLEGVAGRKTARLNRPVQILGSLDGIMTGIRQLKRKVPLETVERRLEPSNARIVFPTAEELLRIKCFLVITRNATRDFLDVAALTQTLGLARAADALRRFNTIYPPEGEGNPIQQLAKQLSSPRPYDLQETHLEDYKGLKPPLTDWNAVAGTTRKLALLIFSRLERRPDPVAKSNPSKRGPEGMGE